MLGRHTNCVLAVSRTDLSEYLPTGVCDLRFSTNVLLKFYLCQCNMGLSKPTIICVEHLCFHTNAWGIIVLVVFKFPLKAGFHRILSRFANLAERSGQHL
jgi:hypothetical protein